MNWLKISRHAFLFLVGFLFSAPAYAVLVFGAPPRESRAEADAVYGPIAQFLTRVTGQQVVYRYVNNWLSYESNIRHKVYDIEFDGPAFIAWRMAHYGWTPLVKAPGNLRFVVIVKRDNTTIKNLEDLAGYSMCAFAPPNLATITIQYEFTNPSRQPNIIPIRTFSQAYREVMSGQCTAGIMQIMLYKHMNATFHAARIVYVSRKLPNQAFSAGPRVTPAMQARITSALLSPQGHTAAAKLLAEFKIKKFVPATVQEYTGLDHLLDNTWGFGLNLSMPSTQ